MAAPNSGLSLNAARGLATGLLVAMAGVYIVAVYNRDAGEIWPYVKAFAEAAMVGALADWFAVTALFRRPLGLPIPHTAVIPNSKARIADTLGRFIVENFLQPDEVAKRLQGVDLAGSLARQIADPATAARLAEGVAASLPALLDLADDKRVSALVRSALDTQMHRLKASPLVADALLILTESGRHQPLINALIDEGARTVTAQEPALRARVRDKTGWLWRLAGVDAQASDALLGAMRETLSEIAADPKHPTRTRVTEWLASLAWELKTSPAAQARVEAIKEEILRHPAVGAYVDDLAGQAKAALRRAAANPGAGGLAATLSVSIQDFATAVLADVDARTAFNGRLRPLLSGLAARHGEDVARLVSETIRGWDTATITGKLEQSVGRDLQYIRINGTLVGGLVGLGLYAITQAATVAK
ncbi:MAG: DUF445 domain-containing protein [Caulobacterales bacterium]